MRRRHFLNLTRRGLLLGGFGYSSLAFGDTHPAKHRFRIYMITYRGQTEVERGFRDYLAANHVPAEYIERDIARDPSRLPGLVAEIRKLKPDLVYTWGTTVTLGIVGTYDTPHPDRYINHIPVVFALVSAPVRSKIAPSRASSGRNVTGAVHVVPTATQLRAMESYRSFQRLGVLYTPTEQNSVAIVGELRELAPKMGFSLIEHRFKLDNNGRPVATGVEDMVADLHRQRADWFYLLPDTFLGTLYDRIAPAALKQRLPTFGAAELAITKGGALVGLISRYYLVGQLAAFKAIQILVDGIPPAKIPIQTLQRFNLIIDMRVAKELSFYPPLAMLNYADIINAG